MFRFLHYTIQNRAAAEDVCQEVFLRVIKGRSSYRRSGSFKAWLFTIARNAVIDRHRRVRVRPDSSFGPDRVELNEELHAEDSQEQDLLRVRVRDALATMPLEQKEVFLLREEAGFDYQTIAELVGCGVPTAKSRMRYALERLRRVLEAGGRAEEGIGCAHD